MAEFRLRQLRERAAMSIEELAHQIDSQPWRIWELEDGCHPRWREATNIAIALGCSLDELAGLEQGEANDRA